MTDYRIDVSYSPKMTARCWEESRWLLVAAVRGMWFAYVTNRHYGTVRAFSITLEP